MASAKARKAQQLRAALARKRVAEARIVEELPLEELRKLPKLSATLLEFSQPLLSTMASPPRRRDLEVGMRLAQIAWNLPLLRQQGAAPDLAAHWDAVAPTLPAPVLAVLQAMMTERRTTYGGDPRLATVEVRFHTSGEYSLYAEARLVTGRSAG